MAYEEMYILGRRILEQTESLSVNHDTQMLGVVTIAEQAPQNTPADNALSYRTAEEDASINIQAKILKTIELLESGTRYGNLLAGLIDSFYDSLHTKRENETLH